MPEFGTCIILTVITVVINALTTPGNASTTRILSMSTAYFSRCSGGPPSTGLGGGVSGTPGVCHSVLRDFRQLPPGPGPQSLHLNQNFMISEIFIWSALSPHPPSPTPNKSD